MLFAVKSSAELTITLVSGFVPPIGANHPARIQKSVGHIRKVKAPMLEALATFGFVPFKIHRAHCRPLNYFGESMAPAWCSPCAAFWMNSKVSLFEHGLARNGTAFASQLASVRLP